MPDGAMAAPQEEGRHYRQFDIPTNCMLFYARTSAVAINIMKLVTGYPLTTSKYMTLCTNIDR